MNDTLLSNLFALTYVLTSLFECINSTESCVINCRKTVVFECYFMNSCEYNYNSNGMLNTDSTCVNIFEDRLAIQGNKMQNGLYRPRGALARAIYEKQMNDRSLRQLDKTEWYRVDKSRMRPELAAKFVQLWPDAETKEFLAASIDKSSWVWTQIWHVLAKTALSPFWTRTDINGWLGRGSMFVLSAAQTAALLGGATEGAGGALVDVGAGDGEVTRRWGALFPRRYATEISASMRSVLADKGFTILDVDGWWATGVRFELVCMLNLLDRCAAPVTLLREAARALAPAGHIMIALVYPFKPYVESTKDHKPFEDMLVRRNTFEEQVEAVVDFMATEGLALVSWSRVPYLCEGDMNQSYYWLDDAVFVFQKSNDEKS